MIEFDYGCTGCGKRETNHSLDSFSCNCGGHYRLLDSNSRGASEFEPHFNTVIGQWVHSWSDMEKKGREFRSPDHPKGFVVTDPSGKFIKDLKNIHRNKEDYIQGQYKKDGINYKQGSNTNYDDNRQKFVPRRGDNPYKRKFF